MINHIKYVKPGLNRGHTTHDCGSPQFAEAPGKVPSLPSPKFGPD